MVQVESEAIDEISYDVERSTLFVRFAHGGWHSYFAEPKRLTRISSRRIHMAASSTSKSAIAIPSAEGVSRRRSGVPRPR